MVSLVHGNWAEVKTLVIGEVQKAVEQNGEWNVRTQTTSCFSRKTEAETFGKLAFVEFHRRGVEKAQAVAAIMDGAECEQGLIDYHCLQATRILDFANAAEHVSAIGETVYGKYTPESQIWLKEQFRDLRQNGPDHLLLKVQELKTQYPETEKIAKNLAYLTKRREQMRYPTFQEQGWPIGSGAVESANEIVVEARLKGSGMHWAEEHVNPTL